MVISETGINLIKEFESCQLNTYIDIAGVPTIGWGHTGSYATPGNRITQEKADFLLRSDLDWACTTVSKIRFPLSQHQFDALVSLVYNIGNHSFLESTLYQKIQRGDIGGAADEFPKWNHSAGKVSAGLTRRRGVERSLFLS